MKLTKIYNKILTENKQIISLAILLEQSIEVGDTLKQTLSGMDNRFANQALEFLTSNNINTKANVKSVDFDKSTGPTFTISYEDNRGNNVSKEMKIQKLLNYLGAELVDIKGYDIEDFMSKLTIADTSDMKIVDGEDIKKYYHCQMYDVEPDKDEGGGHGTMGSCMQHDKTNDFFEIYISNPNQVKMVILLNPENGKIRGRALIWKLDDGNLFMDRIYTTNNQYRKEFENFKEEKKMVRYGGGDVTLENKGEFQYYPYMDHYEYYNPQTGVLSTDYEEGTLRLQDVNGMANDAGEYSDIYEIYIDPNEAYYFEDGEGGGYVPYEYIEYDMEGNAGYYDEDFPDESELFLLTHGSLEGRYIRKGVDEVYELESSIYGEGALAHIDDTVGTYNDEMILHDDSITLQTGTHNDEYAHKNDEYLVNVIGRDNEGDLSDELPGITGENDDITLLKDDDGVAVVDPDNNNERYGYKIFYDDKDTLLELEPEYAKYFK